MAKIAVFGGTFNPFHIGHYQMLKVLCESKMFDTVLVIPDKIPPHKSADSSVADTDRIEMCRLACEDFKIAKVSLIEFEREGKSYTVDTIKELKKRCPGDTFFVACGGDMIKSLDTWYDFANLKDLVTFIAFNRGNDSSFLSDVKRLSGLGAHIIVFDDIISKVSSTDLRFDINKEYLPEKVYEYVNKRGLYKRTNN